MSELVEPDEPVDFVELVNSLPNAMQQATTDEQQLAVARTFLDSMLRQLHRLHPHLNDGREPSDRALRDLYQRLATLDQAGSLSSGPGVYRALGDVVLTTRAVHADRSLRTRPLCSKAQLAPGDTEDQEDIRRMGSFEAVGLWLVQLLWLSLHEATNENEDVATLADHKIPIALYLHGMSAPSVHLLLHEATLPSRGRFSEFMSRCVSVLEWEVARRVCERVLGDPDVAEMLDAPDEAELREELEEQLPTRRSELRRNCPTANRSDQTWCEDLVERYLARIGHHERGPRPRRWSQS